MSAMGGKLPLDKAVKGGVGYDNHDSSCRQRSDYRERKEASRCTLIFSSRSKGFQCPCDRQACQSAEGCNTCEDKAEVQLVRTLALRDRVAMRT